MTAGELKTTRGVLLLGAALNLVFWAVHQAAGHGASDPLGGRLVLSLACAAVAAATWGPPAVRSRVRWGFYAIAFLGTAWWTHRVRAAGLQPEFAVGVFVPPAIVSLIFRRPAEHLVYAAFTLLDAAAEFLPLASPPVSPVLVVACLAAMLLLVHLQIRNRLRSAEALSDGESLRVLMTEYTTDALLLVAPATGATLEANGRARTMLGVPAGGAIGPLAASVFGLERFGPADLARIAAAVRGAGVLRQTIRTRTGDGAVLEADAAVRAVRFGRGEAWLVRLTGRVGAPRREAAWPGAPAGGYRPEDHRALRAVLVAAAGLVIALWFLRRAVGAPPTEPFWQRLVLSAACLAVAAVSLGPPRVRRHFLSGVYLLAYLGSLWWVWRVRDAGLRPDYAVGLMVVPPSVGLGFHRPLQHLLYAAVLLLGAAAAFHGLPDPGTNPWFVLLSMATLLGLTHVVLRSRIGAADALLASDDLRETLFELTNDALVLADPVRREILDCNGRARELFGVRTGTPRDLPLAAVVGRGSLGAVDVVQMMNEIGNRGVFRRITRYAGPGGGEFTGDLAVVALKRKRRQLWLVRVADCTATPGETAAQGSPQNGVAHAP